MVKTVKFRIKDKNSSKLLDQMARDTNFVWNTLNRASRKKWKESRQMFHKFDPWYNQILNGASKVLSINSQTIQGISDQFHKDIHQQNKQLRFRGKKSSKWIPFKGQTIRVAFGKITYKNLKLKYWNSQRINGEIKSGCFTQDITGKWFISVVYECRDSKVSNGKEFIGIDLGLKTTATCSNGEELNISDLKEFDKKIAKHQRARNFKYVKVLHKKKENIKKDKFNKFTLDLVQTNSLVVIGNVNGFLKGKLAKSRYHNSWSLLKNKIEFKCLEYGVKFIEVSEHLTTQTCNNCGAVCGPKGIKELSVRLWKCTSCGVELNRDINAACNILEKGKLVSTNRAKVLAS